MHETVIPSGSTGAAEQREACVLALDAALLVAEFTPSDLFSEGVSRRGTGGSYRHRQRLAVSELEKDAMEGCKKRGKLELNERSAILAGRLTWADKYARDSMRTRARGALGWDFIFENPIPRRGRRVIAPVLYMSKDATVVASLLARFDTAVVADKLHLEQGGCCP